MVSEWIDWTGGDQPVDDESKVEVRLGDDKPTVVRGKAGNFVWDHSRIKALDAHITAYRVVLS